MKQFVLKTLALVLLMTTTRVSAQTPGFQGKRFAVGIQESSGLYLDFYVPALGYQYEGFIRRLGISLKSSASFSYALSRKVSAGVNVTYARQRDNFGLLFGDTMLGTNYYPTKPDSFGRVKTNVWMVDVNFRYYPGAYIAPVGQYWEFGMGMASAKISPQYDSVPFSFYDNVYQVPIFGGQTRPDTALRAVKLYVRYGNAVPLKGRFLIDYSMGLSVFTGKQIRESYFGAGSRRRVYEFTQPYYGLLALNLRRQNLLDFRIGFSYLF